MNRLPDIILDRITRRLAISPLVALLVAVALMVGALTLAIQNDRLGKAEKLRQASVQAQILAGSLTAPLEFDDDGTVREYLNAFRADGSIQAAAAYDGGGKFIAGFAQPGTTLPSRGELLAPAFEGRDLVVTAAVVQGETAIGTVYLRSSIETGLRRAMRYLGIALIVIFACFLVALLGASYASLDRAHSELKLETENREKAEAALRQSQKMEAIGQLTGGVAHDFNNLLMVASSGLDLLEKSTDEAKRDRLRTGIRQAIDRGAKLTQQLLTFARRSPLKPEVLNLGDSIRGMDAMLERSLREDIELICDLPSDLWPVEVDASELEVAVLNMVINARDAMPSGGKLTLRAANRTQPDGQHFVVLTIVDTGSGIAPDQIAKIFEPFFTTKGVGQGTGLGLSQVYGFVQASGGDVQVDSMVGRGTAFDILLPRSVKALPVAAVPEALAARPTTDRRRILLVEDDDSVATMVGEMLEELGFDHDRVASADSALRRLNGGVDVALVLSDMMMPGAMNGLDLVRAVGEKWPKLPVILMTGYSAAATSAAAEGVRLLTKPYQITGLAAEIDAAIEAKR